MAFKEKIAIEEGLTIYIKDTKTGKVTKKVIKPLWSELPLWKKILIKVGLLKYPGTLQNFGLEHAARLFGNVGTPLSINQIGAWTGSWDWKTSNNAYEATGKLVVDNDGDAWATGSAYTKVGCRNSGDASAFNEITIEVDLSGSPTITWWAEITFTFT